MHPLLVVTTALAVAAACASAPAGPRPAPDTNSSPSHGAGCFALLVRGAPSPDVVLPGLIELTTEPASGFVEPGRLAVREPGQPIPRAPISWWVPRGQNALELVLGGGYTGYSFSLGAEQGGSWTGEGTYFADFGMEPPPPPLPAQLNPRRCP